MKVKFNNKIYKKNGQVAGNNGDGLGRLCFDIFKYFLKINTNKTYSDLKQIFNVSNIHNVLSGQNSKRKVIFDRKDFFDWHNNPKINDSKKNDRYFGYGKYGEPIFYNDNELYFTTQWGNSDGNIDNMINFAKKQNYNIQVIDDNINIENMSIKNIILYGAPGVGKTHNYKELISKIENKESQKMIFESITKNKEINLNNETFKTIKKENRVEFVTFHQSYSYEDFIEGFRPNEDGTIRLEDGIFKTIAQKAKENLDDSKKSKNEIESKYTLSNLIEEFKLFIEDKLSADEAFYLKGKATITSIGKNSFVVGGSVSSNQRLTISIIERDYENFKNGKIKSYKDIKSIFESKRGIHGNAPYYFALYGKLKEFEDSVFENYNNTNIEKVEKQNFYIVIDEINRGNISKIFGELITLIEEDKRDEYDITLPYSKKPFTVPSNLYIIATMNSTDKSIATIDIALRRRFTFLKMKPNLELVENIEARNFMEKINSYIKKNLGEDYMLGHSYFMGEDIDLEFIKEYKIKPLLEEYFYADDKPINDILAEIYT